MQIHFASDLHLEYLNRRFPDHLRIDRLYTPFADVLVLAGDIHVGTQMVDKFGRWPHPVLYVPGNHEFYDCAIEPQIEKIKAAAKDTAMIVLACDEYIDQGVRFLGCTLWTDYQLIGTGGRQLASMFACEARIADHRKCNAAFVSDLDDVVAKADFWIHGHVHDSFDYQVGKCRVLANPGSYATTLGKVKAFEELEFENPFFDPQKVIDLEAVKSEQYLPG